MLAALGGEKARCLELAEAWARHTSDLSVLAIWPRGPDDEITTVGWDDVIAAAQAGFGPRPLPRRADGPPQPGPQSVPLPARGAAGRPGAGWAAGSGSCRTRYWPPSAAGMTSCRCSRWVTGSRSG